MDVDQVKVYFPIAKEEECNQRGNARHDQCFVVLILFLAHIAAQSHRRQNIGVIEEEASLLMGYGMAEKSSLVDGVKGAPYPLWGRAQKHQNSRMLFTLINHLRIDYVVH